MRTQQVKQAQQLQYVFECRNSGLTDYQWCMEHDIKPGTFYNWVSKLKKKGFTDIPDPVHRLDHKPVKQEVVMLTVEPEIDFTDNLPKAVEQNACLFSEPARDSVVEIVLPNATIRFINSTDEILFTKTLKYLGGAIC